MEWYYDICRKLVRDFGWSIEQIEDTDYETLFEVVCAKKKEKKIDLIDYMKKEKGLTLS